MEIQKAAAHNFKEIVAFYVSKLPAGYSLLPTDTFFIAVDAGEIVGVVRLVEEEGVLVLRAMQIAPAYQRKLVGTQLLRKLAEEVAGRPCYCIPFSHLAEFYGRIGFKAIVETEAPSFLQNRLRRYQKDSFYILMKRK